MQILAIVSSVVILLLSVILVIFVKPKKKVKLSKGKRIAYIAVLTAVSAICNIFSIDLGVKTVSLTFVALPCFIAGYMFGHIEGFAVGFIGDIIGSLIMPRGAYMPLIGIASGLWGFIPGIIFKYFNGNESVKTVISFILCLFICTIFLNTYGLWLLYGIGKKTFWVYLIARLPWQTVVTLINMFLSLAILTFMPRLKVESRQS